MNTRLLGTIAMLASPFWLFAGAVSGFDLSGPRRLPALLGLVFVIGWACSIWALRSLRVTGSGPLGAWLLGLQSVGLVLAASQQLLDFIARPALSETTFYHLADVAWPLSVLFMLVVGGFTAAKRVWTGWRRWTPLLCGFAVPVLMMAMALGGMKAAAAAFGVYTTVTWGLLGYAIQSSRVTGGRTGFSPE